jgi:hypothetical protein
MGIVQGRQCTEHHQLMTSQILDRIRVTKLSDRQVGLDIPL